MGTGTTLYYLMVGEVAQLIYAQTLSVFSEQLFYQTSARIHAQSCLLLGLD
jgi:hypothetical protein